MIVTCSKMMQLLKNHILFLYNLSLCDFPQTISQLDLQLDFDISEVDPPADPPTSYVNFSCSENEEFPPPPSPTLHALHSHPVPFHTLVLDMAGVCFIDLMGIKTLIKVAQYHGFSGCDVDCQICRRLILEYLLNFQKSQRSKF